MHLHNHKLHALIFAVVLFSMCLASVRGQIVCVDDIWPGAVSYATTGKYYVQEFCDLTNGQRRLLSVQVALLFNAAAITGKLPVQFWLYSITNGFSVDGSSVFLGTVVGSTNFQVVNGNNLYDIPLVGTNFLSPGIYGLVGFFQTNGTQNCKWHDRPEQAGYYPAPAGVIYDAWSSSDGNSWASYAKRFYLRVLLDVVSVNDESSNAKVAGAEPYILFTLGFLCIKLILSQFS